MKKIFAFLLFILLLPAITFAGEKTLTFEWTQVISADFAGWNLYMSETSQSYSEPFATISFTEQQSSYTTVEQITSPTGETRTYYFVLTAFDDKGNESGPSNEVSQEIDFQGPDVPYNLTVTVTSE